MKINNTIEEILNIVYTGKYYEHFKEFLYIVVNKNSNVEDLLKRILEENSLITMLGITKIIKENYKKEFDEARDILNLKKYLNEKNESQ